MGGHKSDTLCRICLEGGASLPIFERATAEGNDIHSKLSLCLREKIEDVAGYPRYICKTCNNIIDTMCNFINKYKETCQLLEHGRSSIKKECYSDVSDNESCKLEIKSEPDGYLDDSLGKSECLVELVKPLQLKVTRNKIKKERRKKGRTEIKKIKPGNRTNKIASSILEGNFSWNGEKWCLKNNETKLPQRCKGIQIKKQREIKLNVTKIDPKPDPPKLCDLCGIVCQSQERLSIHKKSVHFKNPVQCPKCPRVCVSEYYLKRHMKRAHESKRDFICSACGRGFAFKGELTSHFKNVHNKHLKPKKIFSCKLCNKTYKCQKSVIVHVRSVHTGQRPAVCGECGNSFYHEDYLKEHMRLHTGETPFKCPVCGRGYAQRCNMKSHLRIHRLSEIDALTLSKLRPNYLKLLKV